jgi:hypothetical protein
MRSDVVMQNASPAEFRNDEHEEDTQTGCDHNEEVTCYDGLSVVPDERQPDQECLFAGETR